VEILNYARSPARSRRLSGARLAVAFHLVMAVQNPLNAGPTDQQLDEYQVKAAFIYNFARFVQWPSEASRNPSDPITICILGPDLFGRTLDGIVAGRAIEGRTFVVRRIAAVKEAPACQILFFSAIQGARSSPILAELKTPGILTIGDSDASGLDGVVVNFKLEDSRVRFAINMEAATYQKLQISSRLLNLAYLIRPKHK